MHQIFSRMKARIGWVRGNPIAALWRVLCAIFALGVVVHLYALSLRILPVPVTPLMVMRDVGGEDIQRDWISLEDVSPELIYAIIGAEDSRFCLHSGVDLQAIQEVLDERQRGERFRGGSTITQQTAKNVFLWNGGGWIRKAPETWFALLIDRLWGKRRTFELYINVAEWGDGLFGVQAASYHRFGKSASDLSAREAALLAAVLPSPNKWRIDPPGPYVSGRAQTLQARSADVRIGGTASCVVSLAAKS